MNKEPNKEISKEVSKEADVTTMSGCLITVFSKLLGPVFLILCAVLVASQKGVFPSVLDIIYGIVLGLVVLAGFLDRSGQTTDESQAKKSGLSKFGIIMLIAGIALWVIARFILSQLL
jgi:hypothetical protein